jgi:type IV pilus assembly protein PilY1
MTFSFPSEISSIDSGNDGYTDRLYAVDTGGNLWRFDVGDASVANWTATKIFSSNPGDGGSTDVGRKVFYKPSVVSELGYKFVYFGTGDREHPLNTALTDRIYAFKDPDNNTFTTAKTESDLVDVTTDLLQDTTTTGTALQTQISNIFSQLNSSSKYGWYIKLNENSGEKVLAAPTVFNRVLYVTTYAPTTTTSTTACTGNLGTARIYAMDYKTGEAVFNYDTGNGNNYATSNLRAVDSSGHTLTRSDRVTTIGSGIPSGVVALISAGGQTSVMAGVGGKIATTQTKPGGTIIPLYWRQK